MHRTTHTFALAGLLMAGCEGPADLPPLTRPVTQPPLGTTRPAPGPSIKEAGSCEEREPFYRETILQWASEQLAREQQKYLHPPAGEFIQVGGYVSQAPPSLPALNNEDGRPRLFASDGHFFYSLGGGIFDLTSTPPARVGSLPRVDEPAAILLHGSRLVVATNTRREPRTPHKPRPSPPPGGSYYDVIDPCTQGYNCQLRLSSDATTLRVIDASDPAHPTLQRAITVPGRLLAARQSGSIARLVLSADTPWTLPSRPASIKPRSKPPADLKDKVATLVAFEQLRQEIEDKIGQTDVSGLLPWVEEASGDSWERRPDCGPMLRHESLYGSSLLLVAELSLPDATLKTQNLFSWAEIAHLSDDALTMVSSEGVMGGGCTAPAAPREEMLSRLIRLSFSATPGAPQLAVSEAVPGFIMGPTALGEGASTIGVLSSFPGHRGSELSSLLPSGASMRLQGAPREINTGSDIWAAHFERGGGRLAVATDHDGKPVLQILDPGAPPTSYLVGGEVASEGWISRVLWLGANKVLTLEQKKNVAGSSEDRETALRIRDTTTLTTQTTLTISREGASRQIGEPRFFPDEAGAWVVLSLAVAEVEAKGTVEREVVALYRATNQGTLEARGLLRLPGSCAHAGCSSNTAVRDVMLAAGKILVVAAGHLLSRSLVSPEESPAIVALSP